MLDFTLVHCTNWLSQAHLAPIGPLMQQGQWANRSSHLSQSLRAVRNICSGLDLAISTNHCSKTPRKESQKVQQGTATALLRLVARTHGVTQTKSVFSTEGLPSSYYDLKLKAFQNKYCKYCMFLLLFFEKYYEYLTKGGNLGL